MSKRHMPHNHANDSAGLHGVRAADQERLTMKNWEHHILWCVHCGAAGPLSFLMKSAIGDKGTIFGNTSLRHSTVHRTIITIKFVIRNIDPGIRVCFPNCLRFFSFSLRSPSQKRKKFRLWAKCWCFLIMHGVYLPKITSDTQTTCTCMFT